MKSLLVKLKKKLNWYYITQWFIINVLKKEIPMMCYTTNFTPIGFKKYGKNVINILYDMTITVKSKDSTMEPYLLDKRTVKIVAIKYSCGSISIFEVLRDRDLNKASNDSSWDWDDVNLTKNIEELFNGGVIVNRFIFKTEVMHGEDINMEDIIEPDIIPININDIERVTLF